MGELFTHSKLNSYKGRLNKSIDIPTSVANAVALAPSVLLSAAKGLLDEDFLAQGAQNVAASARSKGREDSATDYSDMVFEIDALKSEIAGVQCALAHLHGASDVSISGTKRSKSPTKQQLIKRADALRQSIIDQPLREALQLQADMKASSQNGMPSPVRRPMSGETIQSPGRLSSMAPRTVSSQASSLTKVPSGGGIKDSASGADTNASVASQRGYDAFSTITQQDSGKPKLPKTAQPVVPVSRGEAVILEAALDEALPAGALTAKYGKPVKMYIKGQTSKFSSQNMHMTSSGPASGSPADLVLSSQDLRSDWDLLQSFLSEGARQVAASCAERGRVILKVGERYQEAYSCLCGMIAALHSSNISLDALLKTERATVAQLKDQVANQQQDIATKQGMLDEKDFKIASVSAELEHCSWDRQQEVSGLRQQNQVLADQVAELTSSLEEQQRDADALLESIRTDLEQQLMAVTDERDDLASRTRFLERQVAALRHGDVRLPSTSAVHVQTDPVEFVDDGDSDEEGGDAGLLQDPSMASMFAAATQRGMGSSIPVSLSTTTLQQARKKKKRAARALGGFEGLIASDRAGRVRGLTWTLGVIQQVYQDKIIQDAVADREVCPKLKLCPFIMEWHYNKFGLVALAEANLLDFIASVRYHSKNVNCIQLCAQFIGLQEIAHDVQDTTQHVSFYLFLLQQLAYPAAIATLFKDVLEAGHSTKISAAGLPEVTKAVFRYLGDPDAAPGFTSNILAPLIQHDTTDPTSDVVPLDSLVRAYMLEYQSRYCRASSQLTALFQAGDSDHDGLIDYDTFISLIKVAAPDAGQRLHAAMYSEALRALPASQHKISCATWLGVTRAFGFDRWKADPSAAAAAMVQGPTPGQLLIQGPGVLPLLNMSNVNVDSSGGSGMMHRSASVAMTARSLSPTRHASHGGSHVRRPDSSTAAKQADKGAWTTLLATLRDMSPGIHVLLQQAVHNLSAGSNTLKAIKLQASHVCYTLTGLPIAKASDTIADLYDHFQSAGITWEPCLIPAPGLHGTKRRDTAHSARLRRTTTLNAETSSMYAGRSGGRHGMEEAALTARSQQAGNTLRASTTFNAAAQMQSSDVVNRTSYWDHLVQAKNMQAHKPPTALQAWLAFQLLYKMITAAIGGSSRHGSPPKDQRSNRSAGGGNAHGAPGSPPGSPQHRGGRTSPTSLQRNATVPAMPWRGGRASSEVLTSYGPAASPLQSTSSQPTESTVDNSVLKSYGSARPISPTTLTWLNATKQSVTLPTLNHHGVLVAAAAAEATARRMEMADRAQAVMNETAVKTQASLTPKPLQVNNRSQGTQGDQSFPAGAAAGVAAQGSQGDSGSDALYMEPTHAMLFKEGSGNSSSDSKSSEMKKVHSLQVSAGLGVDGNGGGTPFAGFAP